MLGRSSLKNKKRKNKKQKFKIDFSNWHTTDADEINRRKMRAEIEKFQIKNLEPSHTYFSTYSVSSKFNKKYCIEIRSLSQLINSCDCPDYRSNALGTCKHIEAVLRFLRKKGMKLFKQMTEKESERVEIFLAPGSESTIKISWPKKIVLQIKELIDPFFSSDGSLLGDVVTVFEELKAKISQHKKSELHIRLSCHIQYFIDYEKINLQKQQTKNNFMKDIELGKRTLDIVKFPLFSYQQEGILHLTFTERALLADEMGLGKTVQAVAACELLRQLRHIKRVLVITTASLKAEWEEQIAKFTDLSSLVIFGTRPNRLKQYQHDTFFYLMNYEQVISDHVEIQRLLAPDVVILDEAQRIKNWQTKTANAVKELKSRYAFVLTGTPIENRIDDIYSIVQFLDPHIFGPLFRFNRDFYALDENGKAVGYKNLDELYRRLRPVMLCRRKSDVEDELPKRLNNNYFVAMETEQRIRYEEYEGKVARLVQQAKQRPLRKEEFERLQKWLACMRMICDTPYILDKNCRVAPKLKELENILRELFVDPTTKIIIFSEWERMLQLVKEMAEKNNWQATWHTGSVPQQQRRENIKRFKNDANCRLFLSTDAGSLGLNLQVANGVINLDLPWNPAKLEQRIARAWRKYQTRPVQVINLICENSIEHRMLYLLKQKQLLANEILTGEGDLKTMQMPSGRAAFMQRMEELMGESGKYTDSDHIIKTNDAKEEDAIVTSVEKLHEVFLEAEAEFDLLHSYHDPVQQKSTLLAVCDKKAEELQEKIKLHFKDNAHHIEIIDRNTLNAIQRLIAAGILSYNMPAAVLHDSTLPESKKHIQKKQIETTKKYLLQAERKHKMTQVLIDGDFMEESIGPLQQAFELSLQAFIHLMGEHEQQAQEKFSAKFIQEKLVDQHGMPENVMSLFSHLVEKTESKQDVKTLYAEQQVVIMHINKSLNDAIINLNE